MNKSIKYLIEDIVNFNSINYQDDESEMITRDTLSNILQIPKTKKELIKIIQQRIRENKFGNSRTYFPDLSDIDVSNITDMSNLFEKALIQITKPIKLDLSDLYTSNVTDMRFMFEDSGSLEKLDL